MALKKNNDSLKKLCKKLWAKAKLRKDRDTHTEHCCVFHGCKYGDENCPVVTGKKIQSGPCELCGL
jgi:hypothetical protein